MQSTALERLIFAYGVVAAIVCCAYAYNFTVSDYQHGPKALGVGLIIASVFAFKKFFNIESLHECLSWIAALNALFIVCFVVLNYEVGIPKNYLKVGFTYSNFWDFYYQLLLVAEESYKTISTGYLPLSWAISAFFSRLDGWEGSSPNISKYTIAYYFLFFSICISPLLLVIQRTVYRVRDFKGVLIASLFFGTTYPMLFVFERGNFVLVSFFALCLALYFFHLKQKHLSTIFFAVFFSLKLVNAVLLVTFCRFFGVRRTAFLVLYCILIEVLATLYVFDGDITQIVIFSAALLAPFQGLLVDAQQTSFIVTDGGRLQGMTSWDNLRVILRVLINDIRINETTVKPFMNFGYNLCLLCGFVYYFAKNLTPSNIYLEIIAVLCLVFAFHSGSAEYNLILLYPPLILLMSDCKFKDVEAIAKPLLSFLFCLITVPIILLHVDPHSSLLLSGGVRTLSIPLFLTAVFLIATHKKVQLHQTIQTQISG